MREFMQAGVELIGAEAPEGTAEVIEVLCAALDAAGLSRAVIGLGDADLYRQLLDELGVEGERRARILDRLAAHDLVGLEAEIGELEPLGTGRRDTLLQLPNLRGGREILDRAREIGGDAVERATSRLQATYDGAREARRRRPGPARPRPAARPRLLHRRDPRGLRPGARPHPRRRRPLRRAARALRPRAAGRRVRALPRARARRPGRGGADRKRDERDRHRGTPRWAPRRAR